jgi:hypothetical protein
VGTKAETLAGPHRSIAPFVLAIVLALTIGVTVGSLITRTTTSGTTTAAELTSTEFVAGIQPWDQGMLDAMEGRHAAETSASAVGIQPSGQGASVGAAGIRSWDHGMVDAMEDYQSFFGA